MHSRGTATLSLLNGEIGRIMLPHLNRILSEYDSICIESRETTAFQHELAAAILAASRFSDAQWKKEAISRAKKLLDGDNNQHFNAWLAYRESAVMRMSGMLRESELALETFVRSTVIQSADSLEINPQFNAQRGDLVISYSENLIRKGKLDEAKRELIEWKPLNATSPSSLEKIAIRARDITLGKVLRYQGLFTEAVLLLETVLDECILDDFFEGTGWY